MSGVKYLKYSLVVSDHQISETKKKILRISILVFTKNNLVLVLVFKFGLKIYHVTHSGKVNTKHLEVSEL